LNLNDIAASDWRTFSSDPLGFGKAISFTAPGGEIADAVGLTTKHHIGLDTDGNVVNSKNAHFSVSESILVEAGYPTRDASGEVNFAGHKVAIVDSTGLSKNYVIEEWFPDESIGVITCILGDFR